MNTHEVDKILASYAATIQQVGSWPKPVMQYPMLLYPQSLLEYPKEVIEEALDHAIAFEEETHNEVKLQALLWQRQTLNQFLDDETAYLENHKVLGNHTHWQELKKRSLLHNQPL